PAGLVRRPEAAGTDPQEVERGRRPRSRDRVPVAERWRPSPRRQAPDLPGRRRRRILDRGPGRATGRAVAAGRRTTGGSERGARVGAPSRDRRTRGPADPVHAGARHGLTRCCSVTPLRHEGEAQGDGGEPAERRAHPLRVLTKLAIAAILSVTGCVPFTTLFLPKPDPKIATPYEPPPV